MSERERNSQCPICGKYFHHLGLASHRAACRRRKKREIKVSKAILIIDAKDFPKACPECVFFVNGKCIPQGAYSTTSIRNRPCTCPLMTEYAYQIQRDVKNGA